MNGHESESACALDLEIARLYAAETKPTGRGQPPAEQRWKKGQSGTPAGRPAKPRASGSRGARLLGADQPTRTMILAEAYRMVSFMADGVRREMPQHQAER